MASLIADPLADKHQKDFATLRKSAGPSVLRICAWVLLAVVIVTFIVAQYQSRDAQAGLSEARRNLLASGADWTRDLSEQQLSYRDWLLRRGTTTEVFVFDILSQGAFHSAAFIADGIGDARRLSFITTPLIALHFGFIRVVFIITACARVWITITFLSILFGIRPHKPYKGGDLLGQTGNGRLFYSGLRAGLENTTNNGAPTTQVTGLACPPAVSTTVAASSDLARLLERYSALNETTTALVGIILHHSQLPAYVAVQDEEALLSRAFSGATLPENSLLILAAALRLHEHYREDLSAEEPLEPPLSELSPEIAEGNKISKEGNAQLLEHSFHRVLTPSLRDSLANVSATNLATIVLAFEAGKVMSYRFEGGKWLRRSNFSQLCARSVLHSISTFSSYDYESRMLIRRALIYGSRTSIFGPVRFPIDLGDEARAARQWVELLMACPHELRTSADEVELFGIICEAHKAWATVFIDGAVTHQPDIVSGIIATPTNLFFVPVTNILAMFSKIMPRETIKRLEELVGLVSQKQRLETLSVNSGIESIDGTAVPGYRRIFPPLSLPEVKRLAEEHSLTTDQVRDWSTLRIVLNSFGWLGRRVGDYSVPESSIIHAVFRVEEGIVGRNEFGLIGRSGMIAFRGTKLEAKWGRSWQSRFKPALSAQMAETRADYDKLMRGIEDAREDEAGTSAFA